MTFLSFVTMTFLSLSITKWRVKEMDLEQKCMPLKKTLSKAVKEIFRISRMKQINGIKHFERGTSRVVR